MSITATVPLVCFLIILVVVNIPFIISATNAKYTQFNKGDDSITVKNGYACTVAYLGPIALFYRKQYIAMVVSLVLSVPSLWIINILFGFFANGWLCDKLIKQGWDVSNMIMHGD